MDVRISTYVYGYIHTYIDCAKFVRVKGAYAWLG